MSNGVLETNGANILDIDTRNVRCFLCDKDFVTGDKSFLLFNERSTSECALAEILSLVLGVDVIEDTAHSALLCSECNDVILEYERIDQQLDCLRKRILNAYNVTTTRLMELKARSVLYDDNGICEDYVIGDIEQTVATDSDYEINELSTEVNIVDDGLAQFKVEDIIYEETDELEDVDTVSNYLEGEDIEASKAHELVEYIVSEDDSNALPANSAESIDSYPCDICNETFQNEVQLADHLTEAHNLELEHIKYQCETCNSCFDSINLFNTHKENHCKSRGTEGKKRPYKCEQCDRDFLTSQNLNYHKATHTKERHWICEVCSKSFVTQYNLELHKIVHTGIRPYTCSICGKSFARRAEVIDHERIHTGDRPFKCDLCDLAFAQRSNLLAHKKTTHLKQKLFKCEICERSFKRRRLLDYHTRAVHTGERPYQCEICNSSFVYPEHYKKHLRIHTDERPFACEVCGRRFHSRDNRNAHRFVHCAKKLYECVKCGTGFMRKPLLLAHMKEFGHNSDTIIVNQPQIDKDTFETKILTIEGGIPAEAVIQDAQLAAESELSAAQRSILSA